MRIRKQKAYAILTGDIVGSSKLTPASRRALHRALGQIDTRVRRTFGTTCPLPLDVFRGDGWQLLVAEPPEALRVALFVRAQLRALMDGRADSRVAIGVGEVAFVPGSDVSQGDGPAYRLSGQALDEMPRQARLAARLEAGEGETAPILLSALLVTTDALTRGWTASQARAVIGAMTGSTQEAIAKKWEPEPITQQAVAQHLMRGHWFAIEQALAAFAATLTPEAVNKL